MIISSYERLVAAALAAALVAPAAIADAQTRPFITTPLNRTILARPATLGVNPFANTTARTTFVAGGATLPAIAYLGTNPNKLNPQTGSSTSIFGYFHTLSGVTINYCQTGSGFGKKVFDGAGPNVTGGVNGRCAPIGTSAVYPNGFGAPSSLGLSDPDITGSDSPLAQAEYSLFTSNKASRGEPVEVPSVIGSVALMYNNPSLGTTKLALTDSQICALAEGKISNWSQLGKPAQALHFVYRIDGSGTTFAFSNHLLAVCGTSSGLSTSQQFAPATGTTPPYVNPSPPSNFVPESGNGGVSNTIAANSGYIGYVEAANAISLQRSGSISYATVNGKDPVKDLPQTAAALVYSTSSTIALDSVVVTASGAKANVAPLSPAPKLSGCVVLVRPSAYANITKGYAIVAVTNFLFSSNGNGSTNATNLRKLVSEVNTPSLFGAQITTVNKPTTASGTGTTGFAALGSSFNAPLINTATRCLGA